MNTPLDPQKLYYTPREVARILGEEVHTLYYWQDVFELEVKRSSGGHRRYSSAQVEELRLICFLIRSKGYTTDGVKKVLLQPDKLIAQMKAAHLLQQAISKVDTLLQAFNAARLAEGKAYYQQSRKEPSAKE